MIIPGWMYERDRALDVILFSPMVDKLVLLFVLSILFTIVSDYHLKMSFDYEADFGQRHLFGYGKNIKKYENGELKLCHIFTLKIKKNDEPRCIKLAPGEHISEKWLFGPASNLQKSIIYPCSRYRCQLPCPCMDCCQQPPSCESSLNSDCTCKRCIEQFDDHMNFHIALHSNCKYCEQLLQVFPQFNFFFMNREKQKKRTGLRIFDTKNIKQCKPCRPPSKKLSLGDILKQQADESYLCYECDCSYGDGVRLREHIELNHQGCEKFIHEYQELGKLTIDKIKCEECDYEFVYNKELKRHVKSVHYLVKFDCDQCSATFTRKDSFERHLEKIHSLECLDGFRCDLCNHFFARGENFTRHKHSSLNSDGSLKNKCSVCDKSFCSVKLLRDHSKTHSSEFHCEECDEKFTTRSSLERHIITRNVCQCDECDKTLCHKVSLQRHKFNAHNCVKCDQCDVVLKEAFMKKHKLWKHAHK